MFSVTLDSVVVLSIAHPLPFFSHILDSLTQPRFERGNPHSLNPALAVFSNRFPLERIRG